MPQTPALPSVRQALGAIALATAALLGSTAAHAAPAIYIENGVEFTSGGVGSDESTLMKNASSQWPAALEFAVKESKRDEYASNVAVSVWDANGAPLLSEVVTQGPFLLARLQPGHYVVEATLGDITLKKPLEVRAGGTARALFVWPAGTDLRNGL